MYIATDKHHFHLPVQGVKSKQFKYSPILKEIYVYDQDLPQLQTTDQQNDIKSTALENSITTQ